MAWCRQTANSYTRQSWSRSTSPMFFKFYGTRAGPARVPYGTRTDTWGNWQNQNLQKSRTGVVFGRTGPVRSPCGPVRAVHGLFKISKPVRGPLAYNACIKTLRAPYGEAKFVRRRTGPVRAPWVDVRFLFKTAREQPLRDPGMWCDWSINGASGMGTIGIIWLVRIYKKVAFQSIFPRRFRITF